MIYRKHSERETNDHCCTVNTQLYADLRSDVDDMKCHLDRIESILRVDLKSVMKLLEKNRTQTPSDLSTTPRIIKTAAEIPATPMTTPSIVPTITPVLLETRGAEKPKNNGHIHSTSLKITDNKPNHVNAFAIEKGHP